MTNVQKTIEVNATLEQCFDQWMKFTEFPKFMSHVKSIEHTSQETWHWVVDGPMGLPVEWDAQMDGNVTDKLISWHSIEGSAVETKGAVTFAELSPQATKITVSMEYTPPAGAIGEAIAKMFSDPDTMVQEDLTNFKSLLEGETSIPKFGGIPVTIVK